MANLEAPAPLLTQRLPAALAALLAHVPVALLAAALLASGLVTSTGPLALLIGIGAAWTARRWDLPSWWLAINLVFVPLLWASLQAEIDPSWFLAGFLLLVVTSLGAIRTRVPLYLSSPRAAEVLAEHLPQGGRLIDLGCGLGGPLARIAHARPDAHLVGVEAAPLNWLIARLRLLGRGEVRLGSLWDTNLGEADLVYAYLSPAPMARLWAKARAEMRPGSLLISNSFAVPGVPPDQTLELNDRSRARLLIWRMR